MGPILKTLGLDPHRVENVLGVGTPDTNYTHGWIELKYLDAWPKRETTIVALPKLRERKAQVVWLTRRWRRGGPAYLLLQVGGELLLFAGCDVALVRDGLTRNGMYEKAVWCLGGRETLNPAKARGLCAWLRWDPNGFPSAEEAFNFECRQEARLAANPSQYDVNT